MAVRILFHERTCASGQSTTGTHYRTGDRASRWASALLAGPAALLIVSWLPVILDPEGMDSRETLALVAVIAPALVAARIFLRADFHMEESVT